MATACRTVSFVKKSTSLEHYCHVAMPVSALNVSSASISVHCVVQAFRTLFPSISRTLLKRRSRRMTLLQPMNRRLADAMEKEKASFLEWLICLSFKHKHILSFSFIIHTRNPFIMFIMLKVNIARKAKSRFVINNLNYN